MLIKKCALLNVLAVMRKDKGSNFARSGASPVSMTGRDDDAGSCLDSADHTASGNNHRRFGSKSRIKSTRRNSRYRWDVVVEFTCAKIGAPI